MLNLGNNCVHCVPELFPDRDISRSLGCSHYSVSFTISSFFHLFVSRFICSVFFYFNIVFTSAKNLVYFPHIFKFYQIPFLYFFWNSTYIFFQVNYLISMFVIWIRKNMRIHPMSTKNWRRKKFTLITQNWTIKKKRL